jgi:abortive infection bacteriophage resistance protein
MCSPQPFLYFHFNRFRSLHKLFYRLFRYLIMEMTEKLEIAFRTQISYDIAHTYGVLGHLEAAHFEYEGYHETFLVELDMEVRRSQEILIKHHNKKYSGSIPVWVVILSAHSVRYRNCFPI